MKDESHHLRHVQKKVLQEARKQEPLERMVLTAEIATVIEPEMPGGHVRKHPRHIPAPPRIKSPSIH